MSAPPPAAPPPPAAVGGGYLRYAVLSILMGAALLAGGSRRISASAYQVFRDTGGHLAWGLGTTSVGLVLLLAARRSARALRAALLLAAVGWTTFAIAFATAAWRNPDANLTAVVAYAWIAVVHVTASERAREETAWTPPAGSL